MLWLLGKGKIKVQPEQQEVLGKKTSMPGLEGWEKGLCRGEWGSVEARAPSGQEHGVTTPVLCALPPQHQQQVLQAVERAKQVTMGELNSIVGVSCTAWLWAKNLSCLGVRALQ